MKPASPVVPGADYEEILIEAGPGCPADTYPLPSVQFDDGQQRGYITRWEMTPEEKARFLETGELYIWIWTDDGTMRPIAPAVFRPDEPQPK